MPLELVAETALSNILLTLNMSCAQPSTWPLPATSRQGSVTQQAIRFMRARLADGISIDDVCAATHVSRRTLHNHFEKSLQMSPQQYLKVLRLNLARTLLREMARHEDRSSRQRNIAEIAAQCGYDHASRFAGDYKRQFGILPSETVRESVRQE
jgi:AraC family ethanolamine operon transcriptional activator